MAKKSFLNGRVCRSEPLDIAIEVPEVVDLSEGQFNEQSSISDIKSRQLQVCDNLLRKKFGEKWTIFKEKGGRRRYCSTFVPEIFQTLASAYYKTSIFFLEELLNTSGYIIRQWAEKEEVRLAIEDGEDRFRKTIESIPAILYSGMGTLTPDEEKSLFLIARIYDRQRLTEANTKGVFLEKKKPKEVPLLTLALKKKSNNDNS